MVETVGIRIHFLRCEINKDIYDNFRWMPETPQYLLAKNRRRDAEKALRWLRGPDADLTGELEEMQKDVSFSSVSVSLRFLSCTSSSSP